MPTRCAAGPGVVIAQGSADLGPPLRPDRTIRPSNTVGPGSTIRPSSTVRPGSTVRPSRTAELVTITGSPDRAQARQCAR